MRKLRSRPNSRFIPAGGRSSRGRSWRSGSGCGIGRGGGTGRGGGIGRGGKEGRTRGLKLCPPRVLAMLGLRKGWKMWRGSLLQERELNELRKGLGFI